MIQCVEQGTVVSAVASGLHNHVFSKPQVLAQRKQLFFRRVARRVLALRCIGKLRTRAKHMTMRIDRTSRQDKARLGRSFKPIKPARSRREIAGGGFHG